MAYILSLLVVFGAVGWVVSGIILRKRDEKNKK
jgi:putative effector of murein hydrolase LrgA (UPF0299 family)